LRSKGKETTNEVTQKESRLTTSLRDVACGDGRMILTTDGALNDEIESASMFCKRREVWSGAVNLSEPKPAAGATKLGFFFFYKINANMIREAQEVTS
jgi:hypothetical protein